MIGRFPFFAPLSVVFVLLGAVPASVGAQAQASPSPSNLLGASLRTRPAYDGSSYQRVDVIPLLDLDSGFAFARTVQGVLEGGAHVAVGSGWKVGAQVAWEESRKGSESTFLQARGVPDLKIGASLGVHAEWRGNLGPSPVVFLVRIRPEVVHARGTQADFRGTVGIFRSGEFAAAAFVDATWASAKSARTFYGAPGFSPSAGFAYAGLGLIGSYDLSAEWALFASASGRWLQGDAANSPLTEQRANFYGTFGIGRRF